MTLRLVLSSVAWTLLLCALVWVQPLAHEWRVLAFRWQCFKFRRALQQMQLEKLDRELAALRSV